MQTVRPFPPTRLHDQVAFDLDDAAYIIRQHALRQGDYEEWVLGRKLRDARSILELEKAALELRNHAAAPEDLAGQSNTTDRLRRA